MLKVLFCHQRALHSSPVGILEFGDDFGAFFLLDDARRLQAIFPKASEKLLLNASAVVLQLYFALLRFPSGVEGEAEASRLCHPFQISQIAKQNTVLRNRSHWTTRAICYKNILNLLAHKIQAEADHRTQPSTAGLEWTMPTLTTKTTREGMN